VLRLMRASRMLKRYQTRISINYSLLSLMKSGFMIALVAHWMACAWALQAYLGENLIDTWLGDDGYCTLPLNATGTTSIDFECRNAATIYMASLYWAITTITSIGYGDISPTQGNAAEQAVAVALMLVASITWAQVLGTFCGVIATFNPDLTAFREMMDDLERFMETETLPNEMRQRLREYFHESKLLRSAWANRRLLNLLPPSLKGEVAWMTSASVLDGVWFLKGTNKHFLVQLSSHLHPMIFVPADTPPPGYMYIVERGFALYKAKLLSKGHIWGDDFILSQHELIDKLAARAMTYLEVFFLTRQELMSVAEHFPITYKHIRFCALKLAFKRVVPKMAKELLASQGEPDPEERIGHRQEKIKQGLLSREGTVSTLLFDFSVTGHGAGETTDLPTLDGPDNSSAVHDEIRELRDLHLKYKKETDFKHTETMGAIGTLQTQMEQLMQALGHSPQRQPTVVESELSHNGILHWQSPLEAFGERPPSNADGLGSSLEAESSGSKAVRELGALEA